MRACVRVCVCGVVWCAFFSDRHYSLVRLVDLSSCRRLKLVGLLEWPFVEWLLVEWPFVEWLLVEWPFVEWPFVEWLLVGPFGGGGDVGFV